MVETTKQWAHVVVRAKCENQVQYQSPKHLRRPLITMRRSSPLLSHCMVNNV